jgi:hypothetical protein
MQNLNVSVKLASEEKLYRSFLLYRSCRMIFLHSFHFSVNNNIISAQDKNLFYQSSNIPLQSLKNMKDTILTILLA